MAELETLLSLANPKLRYMRAEKCNRFARHRICPWGGARVFARSRLSV